VSHLPGGTVPDQHPRHGQRLAVLAEPTVHRGGAVPPRATTHQADAVANHIASLAAPETLLVGHSTGGVIAVETAIRHPRLAARLVLDSNLPITPRAQAAKQAHATKADAPDWRRLLLVDMRNAWGHDNDLASQ
jgi:pimeloyl-ACP methyl ester carboxylesterase